MTRFHFDFRNFDFFDWIERVERGVLREALDQALGNQTAAARMLGIQRTTFVEKLKKLEGSPGTGETDSQTAISADKFCGEYRTSARVRVEILKVQRQLETLEQLEIALEELEDNQTRRLADPVGVELARKREADRAQFAEAFQILDTVVKNAQQGPK